MSGFTPINAHKILGPPSPRSEYQELPEDVVNSVEENHPELPSEPHGDITEARTFFSREVFPTDLSLSPKSKHALGDFGSHGFTPEPSDNGDRSMQDTAEEGNTTIDTCIGDTTLDTSLEDNSVPEEETDGKPTTVMTREEARTVREFECVYNPHAPCNTGQFSMHLARKTISDHFGRNKACTRRIEGWPLFCRKHYQRCTYHRKNWQLHKIDLIKRMFKTIDTQFPGIEYTVAMKKSEEKRINEYAREQAFNIKSEEYMEAPPCIPSKGKSFEAPMSLLIKLQDRMGADRTQKFCRETMNIIKKEIVADETGKLELPSIEFLPQIPDLTPSVKKSRVSANGAVQKPQ